MHLLPPIFNFLVMQPKEPSGHIPGLARRRLCQEVKSHCIINICIYFSLLGISRVEGFPLFQQTLAKSSLGSGCIRGFRKPYIDQAVGDKWDVLVMIGRTEEQSTVQSVFEEEMMKGFKSHDVNKEVS